MAKTINKSSQHHQPGKIYDCTSELFFTWMEEQAIAAHLYDLRKIDLLC